MAADPLAVLAQLPELKQLLDLQVQNAQRTSQLRQPVQSALAQLAMNLAPNSAFTALPSRPTLPSPMTTLPSGVNTGPMAPSDLPPGAADLNGFGMGPMMPLDSSLNGTGAETGPLGSLQKKLSTYGPLAKLLAARGGGLDTSGWNAFFAPNPGGAFVGGGVAPGGGDQSGGGGRGRGRAY